jgi:hypothetical protein
MEKASKVMYSIANFFTWIVVILSIAVIVIASLHIGGIMKFDYPEGIPAQGSDIGMIVMFGFFLIVSLITIAMVRRAKADNSSKAWDVFFLIVGFFGGNIFYILGGLFGLIAVRK